MSYASRSGRARTSSSSPQAFAVCDRCGMWYNHSALQWQFDWRGPTLQNIRILVCRRCLDTPQEQLRAITLPADPVPIVQPRTEGFTSDETDYRVTAAAPIIDPKTGIPIPQGVQLVTTDGTNKTTVPLGRPAHIQQAAAQPQFNRAHYGPTISVMSMMSYGESTITVTCSAPHNLATNAQISVEGAVYKDADGAFSVTVTTATAFTYTTNTVVPPGSVMTTGTNVWTILVGLPYNYAQLPQTGE